MLYKTKNRLLLSVLCFSFALFVPFFIQGSESDLNFLVKSIQLVPGDDQHNREAPTIGEIQARLNSISHYKGNIVPLSGIAYPFKSISPIILSYIILKSDDETVKKLHTSGILDNKIINPKEHYRFVDRSYQTNFQYYGEDITKDGLLLFLAFVLANTFDLTEQSTFLMRGKYTEEEVNAILDNTENQRNILLKVTRFCTDQDQLKELVNFEFHKPTGMKFGGRNIIGIVLKITAGIRGVAREVLETMGITTKEPKETREETGPKSEKKKRSIVKIKYPVSTEKKRTDYGKLILVGGIVVAIIATILWHKKIFPFKRSAK